MHRQQTTRYRAAAITAAAIVALSAVAAGCSSTAATTAATTTASKQLNIAVDLQDLNVLDPPRSTSNETDLIYPLEGNTLLGINPEQPTQLEPELATSWGCNSNSTVCTVTLRHDVRFSTGRPFTSANVVYSFERTLYIQGASTYILSTLKEAVAEGPYTVKFILKTSDSAFLAGLTTYGLIILDSKALIAHGGNDGPHASTLDKAQNYLNTVTIGTGPFMLKQWIPGQKLVFVQNPYYWGTRPSYTTVTLIDTPSATTQAQLVEGGEADMALNIDPTTAKSLTSYPNVKVESIPSLNLIMLNLNNTTPGLGNVKVRQAIAYAIDYNGITKGIGGNALLPPACVPLGLQGASAVADYSTDIAKAKQLLRQAGVSHLTLTATFANDDPYGVPLITLWQLLEQNLAAVGIKVNLRPVDYNTWFNDLVGSKLSVTTGIWTPDFMDSADYFDVFGETGATNSALFHQNMPGSVQLVNQYLATSDTAERDSLASRIVTMMHNDATFIPLIQPSNIFVVGKDITGLQYVPNEVFNLVSLHKS